MNPSQAMLNNQCMLLELLNLSESMFQEIEIFWLIIYFFNPYDFGCTDFSQERAQQYKLNKRRSIPLPFATLSILPSGQCYGPPSQVREKVWKKENSHLRTNTLTLKSKFYIMVHHQSVISSKSYLYDTLTLIEHIVRRDATHPTKTVV